jgi:guanylate kinase
MARIISFTGSSGVGKTTLAKALIEQYPHTSMILSYTTRTRRGTDLPGEYAYVSEEEFNTMKQQGAFLWTAERRGVYYGTIAQDVADCANDPLRVGIMILVAETVELLRRYLRELGKLGVHVPVFIETQSKEVLMERLQIRGDGEAEVEKRLHEDAREQAKLRNSDIPFRFITNEGSLAEARVIGLKLIT